jgi:hypothetical protein
VKITSLLTIVLLGWMDSGSCVFAEQPDGTPALRGVIDRGANSDSAIGEETAKSAKSEVTDGNDISPMNRSDVRGELNIDTKQHAGRALKGGVTQTEVNESQDSLAGQAKREIAAIGISWNLFNRVITYVDPGSDLFGKVELGKDRFLGLGQLDAAEVVRTGYNIGDSDTWVDAVIRGHDHTVRHIPVRRRPVSTFAPKFARSFARQYKIRH